MCVPRGSFALAAVGALSLLLGACGDDGASDAPGLSGERARGRDLALASGCVTCHGPEGDGTATGPSLAGLPGTQVTLADGRTVTADAAYLERAVTDPGAEIVEGWSDTMPDNTLGDDQVDAILAWIRALR